MSHCLGCINNASWAGVQARGATVFDLVLPLRGFRKPDSSSDGTYGYVPAICWARGTLLPWEVFTRRMS